ncbi:cadherin EGF LAG seven-pass G-type receptor 3-like [Mercenaria mercenaria]|uniref:cadherin EGF LAG seven-pass G-type receptor 3-like n=1 Tax=Mercenaria mercenaria TaxID=6596 RepID=UPI00234E915C|nr:cadherin EGF LAG seven-pass G-type receptor 3-like [Mercenaria mercenaria]
MKTWISIGLLTLVTLLQNGECGITSWTTPAITAGNGGSGALTSTVDNGATSSSSLGITVVAVTDASTITYALTSQTPTDVTFAVSSAGVVSIGSGTVAYATTSVYTLVITATDDGSATGSASVTLSINDLPAFAATQYGYTIADAAAAGTTLATHTATDVVNSGSLTYTLGGNTNTDFAVSTSGVITTVNAMAASTTGGYSLELKAADASLTGTTTIWVVVTSCSSGAAGMLAGVMTLLMAMTAALY